MTAAVRVTAPAKINLYLDILGKRADGFHDLATVFQAVSAPADTLDLRLSETGADVLDVDGPFAVSASPENTVLRALAALRVYAGGERVPPLHARLEKRIPDQAGLGGGSSDAAAALCGANALLNLELEAEQLRHIAAEVGSDCPFFIEGGTQRGAGRGEVLQHLPLIADFGIVIVVPHERVSTPEAFGALTDDEKGARTDEEAVRRWLAGEEYQPALQNTFQRGVMEKHPGIARTLSALADAGARAALLSGSGSACFGIFDTYETALRVAEGCKDDVRLVKAARPIDSGVRVEML